MTAPYRGFLSHGGTPFIIHSFLGFSTLNHPAIGGIPIGNLLKWRDFFRTATEFLQGRHDVCVGAADEHRGRLLLAFGMEPIGNHWNIIFLCSLGSHFFVPKPKETSKIPKRTSFFLGGVSSFVAGLPTRKLAKEWASKRIY